MKRIELILAAVDPMVAMFAVVPGPTVAQVRPPMSL